MTALITLLVVLFLSMVVTRIATVALTLTGLSRESARFQARSAFTGSGFTTSESELVVRHPVRRRIVMLLMLLGNAGVVAAVGSLMLTFIDAAPANWPLRLSILAIGLVVLWVLATSRLVDRLISVLTARALSRWTRVDATDYAELLHVGGAYRVVELVVQPDSWLASKTLEELNLRREGVLALGLQRGGGDFIGVPPLDTRILSGDRLTLYGRGESLDALDTRRPTEAIGRQQAELAEGERVAAARQETLRR